MKRSISGFLLATLLACLPAGGQIDPALDARLENRSHEFEGIDRPYRLYVPDGYTASERYPLVLFLHGARWAGTDNVTQLDNELAVYWVSDSLQVRFPSFIVWPQIPPGKSWEKVSGQVTGFPGNPELALVNDLLDSLVHEFSIDTRRLYVCGKSIGGLGVYGIIARYPRFAAAVPVAGRYVYRQTADLLQTPLWMTHAKYDNVVDIEQSRHVAGQLEQLGQQVVLTHCHFKTGICGQMPNADILQKIDDGERYFFSEYDTSGHQVEPRVVKTFGLARGVFAQKKNDMGVRKVPAPDGYALYPSFPNPFNAATTIGFKIPNPENGIRHVLLGIYDIKGRLVRTLLDGMYPAGVHRILWNGRSDDDSRVSSGVYFCRFSSGDFSAMNRVVYLK